MPKQLNTIEEAQSKAYAQSIQKIKDALIKDMGLSKIEANYITSFYTAVKEKNIFDSKYFKNFEFEGEVFNLNDIQAFTKAPESFYDVVMFVLHSGAFTDLYDVDFDGVQVKLNKKDIKKEEKKSQTPFDQYKVAEDENYYTFYLPNYQVAQKFRTFYSTLYPDDQDIKGFQNFFFSSWCVISSGAKRHFGSEKHKKDDVWLITYRKGNPAERLRQYFDTDSLLSDEKAKNALDYRFDSETEKLKNQLGEIYLMQADGSLGTGRNYGYHVYMNSPGTGVEETALDIPVSYNYSILNVDKMNNVSDLFVIEDGKLLGCNYDNDVIVVPNGVSTIGAGSFENLKKVKQIVLPVSVTKIESNAFSKLPQLQLVKTQNTLEVIESESFVDCEYYNLSMVTALQNNFTWRDAFFNTSFFGIGVVEETQIKERKAYTISKPAQLRYAPRDMLKAFKIMQDAIGEVMEESTKAEKNKKLDESFRVKRQTYDRTDIYSIEGTELVIDGDPEDFKGIKELVFPEGIKRVKGSFKRFPDLEKIVYPSTLENFVSVSYGNNNSIRVVDLSKSNIEVIHQGAFISMLNLEEIKLPKTLKHISKAAFYGTGIESIFIPSSIMTIDLSAFDNCPFLTTIYTDDVDKLKSKLTSSALEKLNSKRINIEKEH